MGFGILRRINHGFETLEPILLALVALGLRVLLIGRHGSGKTRIARVLVSGVGEGRFVVYDATKDDLISIAGIPDAEALKAGRLGFTGHERSLWKKDGILIDEITRASAENQNLWLEVLEEQTCFGMPLEVKSLFATANPESYAAAFQLDEALLDRFHAVVPVPEHQHGVTAHDVRALIGLAARPDLPSPDEVAGALQRIRAAHTELLAEGAMEAVTEYLTRFVPEMFAALGRGDAPYVSARTYARNVPVVTLAVAAYFRALGEADALERGAREAIRYALASKAQIRRPLVEQIHDRAKVVLRGAAIDGGDERLMEYGALADFENRLAFLETHWAALTVDQGVDGLEKVVGALLSEASHEQRRGDLVLLRATLERVGYRGHARQQLDGLYVIAIQKALGVCDQALEALEGGQSEVHADDRTLASVRAFRGLVAQGLLSSDSRQDVIEIQRLLITAAEARDVIEPGDLIAAFRGRDLTRHGDLAQAG